MTNFELIKDLIQRIETVESDLIYLREGSEPLTLGAVDETLGIIKELYKKLKDVDQALEDEKMGYVLF